MHRLENGHYAVQRPDGKHRESGHRRHQRQNRKCPADAQPPDYPGGYEDLGEKGRAAQFDGQRVEESETVAPTSWLNALYRLYPEEMMLAWVK